MIDPVQLGEILAEEWNSYPNDIDVDVREAITCIVNRISEAFFDFAPPGWSNDLVIAFVDNT